MSTRDELRAKIFSAENRKPKSKLIPFFGVDIELRQPTVDDMLNMGNSDDNDKQDNITNILVKYAYVPESDTNEKVFDEADSDMLRSMPFSKDFSRVVTAIKELTDVDLQVNDAGNE